MSKASDFRALHEAPELLVLVNVWDVASAKVVAGLPGCQAIATASHAVATSFGYPDGEHLPADLMLETVRRIAAAVDLPVTADLEAGYGDVATTVRQAVDAGVVGANIEDANIPFGEAVARMEAAVKAGGPDFVLNARTDQFLGGPNDVDEAIRCGRAFLDVGADCVFVPGVTDVETIGRLVQGIGRSKVSLMGMPQMPPQEELQALGVARLSFGPWPHRAALTALADSGAALLGGGALPTTVRALS
ncbi:MAG TPA: isocitrate lyase/phosphoenolpyruvate mutase family protein [Candidatus Limnocylindrales bacterium]|nr:isocitrate lyase/phosphoenolpyruvate mutase family protein [Candidatus Limnocylindrales bacterium]